MEHDEVNLVAWSQLNLARLLDQVGRRDEAVAAYEVALRFGMGDAERLALLRADRNAPLESYWQHVGVDPSLLTPEEALGAAQTAAPGSLEDERRSRALLLRALDSDKQQVVAAAAERIREWFERDDQAQALAHDRLLQLGVRPAPATNAHATTATEASSELPRETDLSALVTVRGSPDPQSTDGPAVLVVAVAAEVALATAGRPAMVDTRKLIDELRSASGAVPHDAQDNDSVASKLNETDDPTRVEDPVEDVILFAERNGVPLDDGQRCAVRVREVAGFDEIPLVLRRGHALLVRVNAWTSWYGGDRAGRSGRIEHAVDPGTRVGFTTFVIVGCDEGSGLLRFVVGWGPDWGEAGFGFMTRSAADQFLDQASLREVEATPPLAS